MVATIWPFADREGDSISIPAHDEFERIGIYQWQSGPDRDVTSLGSYLPGMTESAALWASGHTARALLVIAKPDCEFCHWFCRHRLGRSWLSDDFRIRRSGQGLEGGVKSALSYKRAHGPFHCYAVAWWMVELTTSPLCTMGVPSITLAKVFTTSG